MEVASASAGVATVQFHRFFTSMKLNRPSKQFSFLIQTRSEESLVYYANALPPVRAILSPRNQCMPEAVAEISHHEDGEIPNVVAEESLGRPGRLNNKVEKVASTFRIANESTLARVNRQLSDGILPPYFLYLSDLGFDLEEIKKMTVKYPVIADLRVEHKIKPCVEFFLDLGMSRSQVRSALRKCPPLCGLSIEENLMPTMAYLESLGIDKSRWERILCHSPSVLAYSRKKIKAIADYFSGLGVPPEKLGKLLTRSPQLFGASLDSQIKPITQFLLDKGLTNEEVGTMVSRFGNIYNLNLERNLIPKWEFFLQTGYPRSEIVKFPVYFGCSLERRIKPRFNLVKEYGITFNFSQLLILGDEEFRSIADWKLKHGG